MKWLHACSPGLLTSWDSALIRTCWVLGDKDGGTNKRRSQRTNFSLYQWRHQHPPTGRRTRVNTGGTNAVWPPHLSSLWYPLKRRGQQDSSHPPLPPPLWRSIQVRHDQACLQACCYIAHFKSPLLHPCSLHPFPRLPVVESDETFAVL